MHNGIIILSENNEHLIGLILAGSRDNAETTADPSMVRYRTSIYPENVGVELLIRDLEIFKEVIKNLDYRLVPHLKALTKSVDYALAGKSSEGGMMIDIINTQKQIQKAFTIPEADKKNEGFGKNKKKSEGFQ